MLPAIHQSSDEEQDEGPRAELVLCRRVGAALPPLPPLRPGLLVPGLLAEVHHLERKKVGWAAVEWFIECLD